MFIQSFNRRAFLKSGAALLCLPSYLLADSPKSKVVLRFVAMSDVHFDRNHNEKSNERIRLREAIRFMNDFSKKQEYPNFDALVVAGDFSNHGEPKELRPFKDILDQNLKAETRRVLCMGNHEYYGGNRQIWEEIFETNANDHIVLNGFHFITISPEKGTCAENDYLYIKEWLDKEIQKAIQDAPSKPIFVVQHYHVYHTVFGSYDLPGDFPAGVHDLIDVLKKYPQVVHISGHSHYPSCEPRSIWQGDFTCLGTGSMSYFALKTFERERQFQIPSNIDVRQAGTFLIVEAYDDNTIRVRLYDVISHTFLDREYLLVDPTKIGNFVFTDRRYETSDAPRWKKDSQISLIDAASTGVAFKFDQTLNDPCVVSYRIALENWRDNAWKECGNHFVWSDFFMKNPAEEIETELIDLEPDSRYRVNVFAQNAFQKETVAPITLEFHTKSKLERDRNELKPAADFLDVSFDSENKRVVAQGVIQDKTPLNTTNLPEIVDDPTLGSSASFNGFDQSILLPFTRLHANEIKNEITIAAKFRLEPERVDSQERVSIFGSTESGGLGFEYDRKTEKVVARCWIDKKYVDLSAPLSKNQNAVLFFTFDGKSAKLYMNGVLVDQTTAEGSFKFTQNETARAFCIGGDVCPGYVARWFFPGVLAFARVYSWALAEEQIAALSIE